MFPGSLIYGVLFLCLSFVTGTQSQECDKFLGTADATYSDGNGACYYGFDSTYLWTDAEQLCQSKDTHLVHVQTTQKQQDIFHGLGPNFQQHWTGLRYLHNKWRWYFNSSYTVVATSDVSGRFQEPTSGGLAITMTSNMVLLIARTQADRYRPVCEDDNAASPSGSGVWTSQPGTTMETTPDQTTVPFTPDETPGMALFSKEDWSADTQFFAQYPSTVPQACALWCLRASGCRHFVFQPSTSNCQLYAVVQSPGGSLQPCPAGEICYVMTF